MNLKEIGRMTPDQINKKFEQFVSFMKEDMPALKKMGICVVATILLLVAGKVANSNLQSSVSAAIEKRDEYKNIQTYLETYQRDAKAYKEEMTKVKGKILDEASLDKSNLFIQKLAENNGVTIVTSQRQEKPKKVGNGVSAQQTRLVVSGPYPAIIKMINEMENASFFISLENLAIKSTANAQNPANDTVEANIDYMIFFEKQDDKPEGGKKK